LDRCLSRSDGNRFRRLLTNQNTLARSSTFNTIARNPALEGGWSMKYWTLDPVNSSPQTVKNQRLARDSDIRALLSIGHAEPRASIGDSGWLALSQP